MKDREQYVEAVAKKIWRLHAVSLLDYEGDWSAEASIAVDVLWPEIERLRKRVTELEAKAAKAR